jgi:hypothetical protein
MLRIVGVSSSFGAFCFATLSNATLKIFIVKG